MSIGIVAHIAFLKELGAADRMVAPGGNLLGHLVGTSSLLRSWGAREALCLAGLYHAAYEPDAGKSPLMSPTRRFAVRQMIGAEAEEIVYLYGSAPVAALRQHFLDGQSLWFESRFDGSIHWLGYEQIRDYCALTAAREVDIASRDRSYLDASGAALFVLFKSMFPWLGEEARQAVHDNFAVFEHRRRVQA